MQLLPVAICPTCKVVMATSVVACMCVQSTMVERTRIMPIQPRGDLLPEAILLVANMLPWQLY